VLFIRMPLQVLSTRRSMYHRRLGVSGSSSSRLEQSKGKGRPKGRNIAPQEQTPHRATERHLSYGITQCYLPFDTGERAPP